MKILKAMGSFLANYAHHIVIGLFLGILAASSVIFWKEPTLQSAVFLLGWLILTLGQLFILALQGARNTQYDIQRELAKLRHPSAGPKPQLLVVDMPRFNTDFSKEKIGKLFPEPKNRDDINESLRYAYSVPAARGGIIPKRPFTGEPIKLSEGFSTDPRMTAKVTGEFPLTDDEWRNKIENTKAVSSAEIADGCDISHLLTDEQDRTIADPLPDDAALTDEQWETIEKGDSGPNPQPEEMREPFDWAPPINPPVLSYDDNDYSPDSPHYGKPHEDCCK